MKKDTHYGAYHSAFDQLGELRDPPADWQDSLIIVSSLIALVMVALIVFVG